MSSSFGIRSLVSEPGGARRMSRTSGSRHLPVLGGMDVAAGLVALAWPGVTVLVLGLVFGLMLLLAGMLALGIGSVVRRAGGRPVATWVVGGIAVMAGLICLFHPGAGAWAIVLGCALWFLLTGVAHLLLAAATPAHRVWYAGLGVLSVAAALVLLIHPGVAIVTVALVAGIAFLVRGAGELALGRRLRVLSG